ncbi:MAG: hypothetical protein EA396_03280 [Anaerolineaceae bacterium]|nr:MAG: hypothetical protein EA396_03280 [Anaerolineaceae bacterium]
MAKLPNGDRAVVPVEKLVGYSLNPEHETGKHKARVFKAALGLTHEDALFLRSKLLSVVRTHPAIPQESTPYGHRYVIDFELKTSLGSAIVRSAWIVRNGEDFPRLTSCYVKDNPHENT